MHGSQSRVKPRRATEPRPAPSCHSPSAGRSPAGGSVQSKTWSRLSSTEHVPNYECRSVVEEDLITLDFKRRTTKAIGMPIKTLIDEELSREKHSRRSSPSLIARLMGLDTLPSPGAFKPLKEVRSSSKKVLSKEFHENSAIDDCSESKNDEHQEEFKDVFEVVQVPKVEKQNDQSFKKENASLRRHEIGKTSIPQCFTDAISCSTYRMPQRCRHIDDSVEAIDLNNDMFLPFLEESSKHLHNLTQKPSFRSERNVDMHINRRGNDSQSSRKLTANGYDHASREYMCSILHKFAQSTYAENNGCSTQPTQIVILKPSLGKFQKAERTIPSAKSLNNLQYGLKNTMQFPVDELLEPFIEERGGGQNLLDKVERMGHKIRKPKEMSKRNRVSCDRQKVSIQNFSEYEKDDGLCTKSSIMKGKNTQTSLLSSAIDCEFSNNYSHSTESSVTKEARKRLSERWKSTNDFQEMGFLNRESNTLAEMLALSEMETPKLTLDALAVQKIAGKKSDREDFLEHRNHPLGISSKDGWKDDFFRSLPKSKSLPESTLVYVNSQLNSRNRSGNRNMLKKEDDLRNWMSCDNDFARKKSTTLRNLKFLSSRDEHHSDGEENTLAETPEKEIHVSSEELKSSNNLKCLSEKHAAIEPLDDSTKRSDAAENFSISQSNTEKKDFEKLGYLTKSENIVKQFECDEHEFAPKEDQTPAPHCYKSPAVSPGSFNDADQPSPVSVLEVPFEEDEFAAGCFEKISADLQELRMQLRLLKQESPSGYKEEDETLASSDEDEDTLQPFRDEEERDYSYILDMLIDCEILKSSEHFPTEYPVDLHVFEELEKKYKSLDLWSRSDRKLLFDLTNIVLEDIVERNDCRKSRMVRDGLVEEVWQRVVKERKAFDGRLMENLNGIKWADSVDGKELVGRHVEKMLQEDLVAELMVELAPSLWLL